MRTRRSTVSKLRNVAIAALAVLAVSGTAALAANQATSPKLVRTIMDKKLGEVLTTSNRQAIYVWKSEPKGKIRCTGACAKAWPPVLVKKGVVVPMHYAGIMGDFGTIRRPDGTRQLTLDRRALYTYAHEKPGQVLCNDVDNWFAVKIHS
jgi:predicted lipoprotein with Yx(FWY)xxD motif